MVTILAWIPNNRIRKLVKGYYWMFDIPSMLAILSLILFALSINILCWSNILFANKHMLELLMDYLH